MCRSRHDVGNYPALCIAKRFVVEAVRPKLEAVHRPPVRACLGAVTHHGAQGSDGLRAMIRRWSLLGYGLGREGGKREGGKQGRSCVEFESR